MEFSEELLEIPPEVNETNIRQTKLNNLDEIVEINRQQWMQQLISYLDLTLLTSNAIPDEIKSLTERAIHPFGKKCEAKCAAICIYPARIKDAVGHHHNQIKIATVAAGFPSGQYGIQSRLQEIEFAVQQGADEIDVVIDRSLAIRQMWQELYLELKQMRSKCQQCKMKTILANGELMNLRNIYKASIVAMMAGSDFIKTSTGKEQINADLSHGFIMCLAIRKFYQHTKIRIGLKPAGGVKTVKEALLWMALVKQELGEEWLTPELFRIGASSLLEDIRENLDNEMIYQRSNEQ